MSTASNPKDYKSAWQTYILEMRCLFDTAGKTNDEWNYFIHSMQIIINTATERTFPILHPKIPQEHPDKIRNRRRADPDATR